MTLEHLPFLGHRFRVRLDGLGGPLREIFNILRTATNNNFWGIKG